MNKRQLRELEFFRIQRNILRDALLLLYDSSDRILEYLEESGEHGERILDLKESCAEARVVLDETEIGSTFA